MNIIHRIKCWLGFHCWVTAFHFATRRACRYCYRREVLSFRSRYMEVWSEHVYPLGADPAKDLTVVSAGSDGETSTIGEEYELAQLFSIK